ncbi:hypothetical protein N8D56_14245 [Devosia sp. A8/3-2]|nr:hypothetical protein N8D56_14245 [Devosia sp. A8/3-2]
MTQFQLAKAGPHHEHDAGKARQQHGPAHGMDAFLEQQHRHCRDEERHHEDQRIGLGKGNGNEGEGDQR